MRSDWTHLFTVMLNVAVIAAGVGALAYLMVAVFVRGTTHG